MNNRITQNEFSESLDRRLSGLQGDPWLAAKVLSKAEGEKPMKKKLSATAIIVIALLAVTLAGALAIGISSGVIGRLMSELWDMNEEALVTPLKAETTLKWLEFTATEAYWTEDGLTLAIRVDCTDPDCMPYYEEGEHPEEIEYNGETVDRGILRGDRQLIACEIWWPQLDCWCYYEYTDAGFYYIITIMEPNAERLSRGTSLTFNAMCENLQTGERESGTLTVDLPPMEMQPGIRDSEEE